MIEYRKKKKKKKKKREKMLKYNYKIIKLSS